MLVVVVVVGVVICIIVLVVDVNVILVSEALVGVCCHEGEVYTIDPR